MTPSWILRPRAPASTALVSMLLVAAAVALLSPRLPAQARPPNVVVVFIDDMGWSDLSSFGGTRARTESIDRLAAEGIRFTSFYVNSPICSPSRVALTTGQYPHRWRITSYLAARRLNEERGVAQWLDPSAPVLARELRRSGYATGHFGKWHMGGQRDVGEAPLIGEYGFDASLTNFEGLGPRVLPLCDAYDGKPPRRHDLGSADLGRGPIRWEDRSVVTAAFVDDALRFIDSARVAGKPFYINLWPDDVHSPFFPPEALRKSSDGSKRALYYSVLDAMDEQLGRLFDRIRADDALRNDTLILIASDNGHEEGAGSSDPLRGAKTWLFEGGVRSPLIVWGPGVVAPQAQGTTNDSSVLCALDVNRSLYALTGTPLPEGVTLDGEDLSSTLLGKARESRRAPIFWRRPPDRPGTKAEKNPDLAVRAGKWKLYCDYDGSGAQLYDLEGDISETRDLAEDDDELVERLRARLLAWNASLPVDAGDPSFRREERAALSPEKFVVPIGEGADPWVVRDPNAARYLWCFSEGNRGIAVHTSERLSSLGEKHVVWRAPESGPWSREVWAPELHWLDGRWHVYFAASDGRNENHLAYVLRSESDDPLGPYALHGPLATGEGEDGRSPNIWAIDMTVLTRGDRRFAIWSGWDAPGTDRQFLYIAPMRSPTELAGRRVRLCANDDHLWERVEPGPEHRGLHEAPQVLVSGKRTFVVYSCGASWLPTYKLGLLELRGDDPLDPAAWEKRPEPVFVGTEETFGVGHSCFVRSPDESEWWHVFHAKRDRRPGWRRAVFVQPMGFDASGQPSFGRPVRPGAALERPSGEVLREARIGETGAVEGLGERSAWSYFGHHQMAVVDGDAIRLGRRPDAPINDFSSGEKLVLDRLLPRDLAVEVAIDFLGRGDARSAGVLVRCTGASLGYDAHRGYFAGVLPAKQSVILGRMDGVRWTVLARAAAEIDASRPQRLRVEVVGPRITLRLGGEAVLALKDDTYVEGSIGLRVVDTDAVFRDLRVERLP